MGGQLAVETDASLRVQLRAALIRFCLAAPLIAGRALLFLPSRAMGLFLLPSFFGWVWNDMSEAEVV